MLVVDTNVLIYAADLDSPFHGISHAWLEAQRRKADAWYCTWPIVYDFLRVTTHPRVMRKPWTGGAGLAIHPSHIGRPRLQLPRGDQPPRRDPRSADYRNGPARRQHIS